MLRYLNDKELEMLLHECFIANIKDIKAVNGYYCNITFHKPNIGLLLNYSKWNGWVYEIEKESCEFSRNITFNVNLKRQLEIKIKSFNESQN